MLARLATALVLVAPLACVTATEQRARQAQREAALARVPANAPSGLFVKGRWAGSITGEPAMQYASNWGWRGSSTVPLLGQRVTREFDVEVSPWRDSTRLALAFETVGGGVRTFRMLPRAFEVAGDTVRFGLPTLLGHADVTCRLVMGRAGTWDGPCHARGGDRAGVMTLAVPRAPEPAAGG